MSALPAYLLSVEVGDPIRAQMVRDFAQAIAERTFLPGAGVRLSFVPGFGAMIEAEAQTQELVHPWQSSLSGSRVTIRTGALNTIIPWIDGRAMDGLKADGTPEPKGVPSLELDPGIFTEEGYSWGVIRAKVDPVTGKLLKVEDGGLIITQTKTATWLDGGSVDVDGTGDHPIFQLRRPAKDKESLGTLSQISFFNAQHRFVAGADGKPGRHFFWA